MPPFSSLSHPKTSPPLILTLTLITRRERAKLEHLVADEGEQAGSSGERRGCGAAVRRAVDELVTKTDEDELGAAILRSVMERPIDLSGAEGGDDDDDDDDDEEEESKDGDDDYCVRESRADVKEAAVAAKVAAVAEASSPTSVTFLV